MNPKGSIAALIAAVLLAGCASATVGLRTTNSPSISPNTLPPVSSYSSVSIQADMSPGAYFSALLFGYLLVGLHNDYRNWRDGSSWRAPPDLDQNRSIAERDCSQPMDPPTANLRCK